MIEGVVSGVWASVTVAVIVWGFLLTQHRDHKINVRGHLMMATGYGLQVVGILMYSENKPLAVVPAACMAWCLYDWWNGGGGDGLKRRLKSWAQSFGGAAPQAA